MSGFDILIVSILVVSTLMGGWRGVIKEAIALAAWGIGLWCAFRYAQPAGSMLQDMRVSEALNEPMARHAAGFAVVLIGAFLGVTIAGRLIRSLVCAIGLTPLDRVAGLGFGFARGALIVVALVTMASATPMAESPAWQQSHLVPPTQLAAQMIMTKLPPDVAQFLQY